MKSTKCNHTNQSNKQLCHSHAAIADTFITYKKQKPTEKKLKYEQIVSIM